MIEEKKIKLDFLGGAMEVGASCILAEINGYRILLDCGIRQKAGMDPMPDLRRIQECGGVDVIVVSHAHMDHTGTLPVVSKAYPMARIYMTSMTIDLVKVLLYDSIKLMNRQEEGIPIYAQKDVEAMLIRLAAVHYEQPLEILPGLKLTMYQAGHIAGAACIFLESDAGSLFYSGDFSGFAQNAIEGLRVPKLRPDVAIVESTYGDRLHANRQIEENRLIEAVGECIEKKGKMIIPAFALGRAQEVLLILRKAMNKGILPEVKIYVDGMVRDMNIAFERNPWYLKNALAKRIDKGNSIFYSDQVVAVSNNQNREQLLQTTDPVIFVASSGMLTGGPSVIYAAKIVSMENGYLAITGYQDEEAPGRMVQQLLEDDAEEHSMALNGQRIPVRCQLRKIGLSAHGDQGEIQNLLERLSSRHVFLVHGDSAVIENLSKSLDLDYRTKIYTPRDGDTETIWLKNPRKQWKKSYPFTMQKTEPFGGSPKDGEELYQYWIWRYPGQKYTVAELAYIWSGKYGHTDRQLEQFQQAVLAYPQFDRDVRRLFLFIYREPEAIEKAARREDWNQQTLKELAQTMFAAYEPRKIGYYEFKKEIALQIDFPGRCGEDYEALAEAYQKQTDGWKIVRNENPNEQAIRQFIYEKTNGSVGKIAIHMAQGRVIIHLDTIEGLAASWEVIQREFNALTGYQLLRDDQENPEKQMIVGIDNQSYTVDKSRAVYLPEIYKADCPVEQNMAFTCIDQEFAEARYRPYKRGLKNDSYGKYIELSFLSPNIGYREGERIQRLSDQTGWRYRISDAVNQNEVLMLAKKICTNAGIVLKKTPSYQPMTNCLGIKLAETVDLEVIKKVTVDLQEATGLRIKIE